MTGTGGKGRGGPAAGLDELRRRTVHMLLSELQTTMMRRKRESTEDDRTPPGGAYEIEELLNIPYINRQETPLAMDVYKPVTDETAELPVIVTLYGGGLIGGDRKTSRRYARELASRGYLVFAIEYRLVPTVDVSEELDDICAGLDLVGKKLVDFNVDFTRMFLTGSSAGAYLAIYAAAMKDSVKLQKAVGYEPSHVRFKALGVDCGMFYTNRRDPIGLLLSEQFYGEKRDDPDFLRYCDPENPEILNHLPPVFLDTSRGDFLNRYTLAFHRALKKAGKPTKLVYYGEKELRHAFVAAQPELEQSRDVIERMLAWFEQQADAARSCGP